MRRRELARRLSWFPRVRGFWTLALLVSAPSVVRAQHVAVRIDGGRDGPAVTQVVADRALAARSPLSSRVFSPSGQAWPRSRAAAGLASTAGWNVDLGEANTVASRAKPGQGARVRVGQGPPGTYFVLTLTATVEIEDEERSCEPPSWGNTRALRSVPENADSPLGIRSLLRELKTGGIGSSRCRASGRTADLFIEQVGSAMPPERLRFALGTATDWRGYPAGEAIPLGAPIPLQTGLVHGQRVMHQIAFLVLDTDVPGFRQLPVRYTARLAP